MEKVGENLIKKIRKIITRNNSERKNYKEKNNIFSLQLASEKTN